MIDTPEQLAAALQTWLALSVKRQELDVQMKRIQSLVLLAVEEGLPLADLYWPVIIGRTAVYLRDGALKVGGADVLPQQRQAELPADVEQWLRALEEKALPKRDDNIPF